MRDFQKLETPQLIELEGEIGFIIATEIDVSEMRNSIIFMKGKSYNYEDGEMDPQGIKEVQYSLSEDAYHEVDEHGRIID